MVLRLTVECHRATFDDARSATATRAAAIIIMGNAKNLLAKDPNLTLALMYYRRVIVHLASMILFVFEAQKYRRFPQAP